MSEPPQHSRRPHRDEPQTPRSDVPSGSDWLRRWFPLSITLVYALGGGIWIAASDMLLREIAPTIEAFHLLETWKGWLFVGVTSVLLYFLLSAAARHLRFSHARTEESLARLDLALRASRGGIWDHDLETDSLYISPHVRNLLGLQEGTALTPKLWRDLIHPEDLDRVRHETRAMYLHPDREQRLCYRVRHQDGAYRWLYVMGRLMGEADDGPQRMLGVVMDVTASKEAEERVDRLIHFDALTGLPNRRLFETQVQRAIDAAPPGEGGFLVAVLNLYGFTKVNSELGVEAGDEALVEIGRRLSIEGGPDGMAARLGADEFAVLLRGVSGDGTSAERMIRGIERAISNPVWIEDRPIHLEVGIGAALYPADGITANTLLTHAAVALAQVRKEGGKQTRFYAAGMNEAFQMRARLGRELRAAMDADALDVHFQPVVRIADRGLAGFEALARWHHPIHGAVPPATFIPIAEELGLIDKIGRFMIREACRRTALWNAKRNLPLIISVNLSPIELASENLDADIAAVLEETALSPSCLELEVTESALMGNIERAAETLGRLRALGVSIAIDDFGTGYSSLEALRRLPVSRLKIDRSFVDGYGPDPEDTAIVDSILGLARALGLSVTAEGVEEESQFARLKDCGCEKAQGYLFGKPMPGEEAERSMELFASDAARRAHSGR